MAVLYIFAVSLLVLSLHHVNAQDNCTQSAQSLMQTCAQNGGISMPNFLWFVTNGTSQNGQAPADEAAFKTQICQAEQQVGGCIYTQLPVLANTTCSQTTQVLGAVQNFLITYDNKCADPCRFTLIDDLRQCYVDVGLSPDLFLSNRSAGHVIGSTQEDVTMFCQKRQDLLNCMKPIHDSCPEALPILSLQDFHLPSYEKGVTILCNHPQVYLTGLMCFEEPTPQVEACIQKSQQAFLQANIEAQSKNWTESQFITATCKVTIDQTDCDVTAWSKKNHDACTSAVIGLRREMECNLLPPNCTTTQKTLFDRVCHSDKFNQADRNGGGGSGAEPSGVHRVFSLPGALLCAMAFLMKTFVM